MSKPIKLARQRDIKLIIEKMEETRPSITLGKADIAVVLPILKQHLQTGTG